MRHTFKKAIFVAAAVAAVVGVGVAAYAGYVYYMAASGKADVVAPKFSISPSEKIKLGDVIVVGATLKCPWGHVPDKAELSVPKGLQVVQEPVIRKAGNFWGSSLWSVQARVQPFRTGKIAKSECVIRIRSTLNGRTRFDTIKSSVPGFDVLAVDTSGSKGLYVAPKAKERTVAERNPWLAPIIALIALVASVVILVLWLGKRKTIMETVALPPWTLALSLLEELRTEMRNGAVRGELCVVKLTDIVRNYIEQRFKIHAPSQTTHEFLADLESGGGELEADHRKFLREFMTAADLVKFANLPADKELLDAAIDKAEALVESTKLEEDEEKDKRR